MCVENIDGDGLDGQVWEDHFCVCEDGFVSRDFAGAASCVSQRIQLTMFSAGTVVHLASSMLLGWHAAHYLKLPVSIRSSRRAKLHLRLGVSTRCAWPTRSALLLPFLASQRL